MDLTTEKQHGKSMSIREPDMHWSGTSNELAIESALKTEAREYNVVRELCTGKENYPDLPDLEST